MVATAVGMLTLNGTLIVLMYVPTWNGHSMVATAASMLTWNGQPTLTAMMRPSANADHAATGRHGVPTGSSHNPEPASVKS